MTNKEINVHLWDSRDEEMTCIHQMNNIVRYNTRNKINPESVASHSFFTAYFVLSICKDYGIDDAIKLLALESAVLHDVPEVFINDITYDCKKLVPEIEEILKPYERSIIGQFSESSARILFGESAFASEMIASAIVELADVLSVKQYAMSEVELGNKAFESILIQTERRVYKAEIALNNLLSACNKNNSTKKGI